MTCECHRVGFYQVPPNYPRELSDNLSGTSVEQHLQIPETFGQLDNRLEGSRIFVGKLEGNKDSLSKAYGINIIREEKTRTELTGIKVT